MGSILAESHNFIETLRKNNDKKKYITLENSLNNQSTDVLMYWGEFILLIITCIYLKINDIHVISHDKQYLSCIEIITRNFFVHVFSGFSDNNSELLMENPIYINHARCVIFKGRLQTIKLHTIHYVSVYIKLFLESCIQAIS